MVCVHYYVLCEIIMNTHFVNGSVVFVILHPARFAGDMHYFYLMKFYIYILYGAVHTYIVHVCRCTLSPQVVVRKCLSIAAVCVTTVDLDGATTI